MRASEALILGSTMLMPVRRTFDDSKGHGCALGMINRALGGNNVNRIYRTVFPWMSGTAVSHPLHPMQHSNVENTVVSLFDNFDWSVGRIADWLETVDPTPREITEIAAENNSAVELAQRV